MNERKRKIDDTDIDTDTVSMSLHDITTKYPIVKYSILYDALHDSINDYYDNDNTPFSIKKQRLSFDKLENLDDLLNILESFRFGVLIHVIP